MVLAMLVVLTPLRTSPGMSTAGTISVAWSWPASEAHQRQPRARDATIEERYREHGAAYRKEWGVLRRVQAVEALAAPLPTSGQGQAPYHLARVDRRLGAREGSLHVVLGGLPLDIRSPGRALFV